MIVLVALISLLWIAGGVVCMTIIYRAGIEEGIRRANSAICDMADRPALHVEGEV